MDYTDHCVFKEHRKRRETQKNRSFKGILEVQMNDSNGAQKSHLQKKKSVLKRCMCVCTHKHYHTNHKERAFKDNKNFSKFFLDH